MIKLYADDDYEVFLLEDSGASAGFTSDRCAIYVNGEQVEYQWVSVISNTSRGAGIVQSLAFIDGNGLLHHGMAEPSHLARESLVALDFCLRARTVFT